MPYSDREGQCTFTREAGESILDPEAYVCKCAGCDKEVTGRVHNRSRHDIAKKHRWVALPDAKRPGTGVDWLYCSVDCAIAHDNASVVYHAERLRNRFHELLKEAQMWEPERYRR